MRWVMIGIGTMTLLLALVLVSVHLDRRPPRTAQEAISIVLRQQGMAFEDIRLENGRCLPTPEQCSVYRADVVVVAEQSHRGLMQCWEIDRKCELWIADLGLDAPLPDLAPTPAWMGEIERLARAAAAWMREMLNHNYRSS
jgi:hypothetical protein